jgi:UDP-N-acetylmuramate: L-alanyl-gamma-D-glutamyl-meso-diaminopimelate ligase
MRIHVVAVAGTGMGSLAGLLRELGHEVSGSDVSFDPPMGPALKAWGVRCLAGFDAAHLDPAPDLVIVGNVCRRDNPEVRAAFERGLEVTHIAGALQRFVLERSEPLVVAGTHGKTTTSSLAAWLLEAAGRAPGFLIGGIPKNFERGFRAPRPRLPLADRSLSPAPFVLEGDEYDTAFFEKTAKFLHYRPRVAIVTSIEHDHVDIYPTEERYLEAFEKFVEIVPEDGLVVACGSDPRVVSVVGARARAPVSWYGIEHELLPGVAPHWMAAPAPAPPGITAFDLYAGGVACGRFTLPLTGRHNLLNALAAIGAVAQGFGVPLDRLGAGLARFEGVKRRQEVLGAPRGITVYDDFAHHPTAVRETLAALRSRHPTGRLFAVFEPRSATACRALHQQEYARSFDGADHVLLAPAGRELPEGERLDRARLVADLRARGKTASAPDTIPDIVRTLVTHAKPGDSIALLSNGAFGGIHQLTLKSLESEHPS